MKNSERREIVCFSHQRKPQTYLHGDQAPGDDPRTWGIFMVVELRGGDWAIFDLNKMEIDTRFPVKTKAAAIAKCAELNA